MNRSNSQMQIRAKRGVNSRGKSPEKSGMKKSDAGSFRATDAQLFER